MSLRLACRLSGCWDNGHGHCRRCGAWVYEDFIVATVCDPLQRWWWIVRDRLRRRACSACNRRLPGWGVRWGKDFCSEECREKWIPF